MIVVCKKETKKLVKGLRYEVKNLWNNGQNQSWMNGKIEVKGVSGRYSVNNFTDTNDNPIPYINYSSPKENLTENLKFSDLKKGDILVCEVDAYKTMMKGGMYKIENLETYTYNESYTFIAGNYTIAQNYIKFEGIKRKLKFNSFRFRKLTPKELREIQLGSLLEGKEPEIIKTTDIDKFDKIVNKEKFLMELLSKSILDKNRHHLSILEWACKKTNGVMTIKEDSYKDLLNMSLKDILEKIENQ